MRRFAILSAIVLTLLLADRIYSTVSGVRSVSLFPGRHVDASGRVSDDSVRRLILRGGIIQGIPLLVGVALSITLFYWPRAWLVAVICCIAALMAVPSTVSFAYQLRQFFWPPPDPPMTHTIQLPAMLRAVPWPAALKLLWMSLLNPAFRIVGLVSIIISGSIYFFARPHEPTVA